MDAKWFSADAAALPDCNSNLYSFHPGPGHRYGRAGQNLPGLVRHQRDLHWQGPIGVALCMERPGVPYVGTRREMRRPNFGIQSWR